MSFKGRPVKGVLLDISGVLAESSTQGDGVAISGSPEAVEKLKLSGIPVRFVTNETQRTRRGLMDKLHRLGFSMTEKEMEATVCGKPSADFFSQALADIGVSAADAVMVGDDVVSDVGGAQTCGMRGVLVRTGKFRKSDEEREDVKPDAVVDNLAAFVKQILA